MKKNPTTCQVNEKEATLCFYTNQNECDGDFFPMAMWFKIVAVDMELPARSKAKNEFPILSTFH